MPVPSAYAVATFHEAAPKKMSLDQDVRQLARLPHFAGLPPEALRLLAFSAEPMALKAGEVLLAKGQSAEGAYIVLAGAIVFEGGRYVAGPDSLIGESALLAAAVNQGEARAQGDASLLKISRSRFLRVMSEYPEAAAHLHALMAQRLASFTAALEGARRNNLT